ncbi:MAG: accessory gene regulator B family protein [Clostridiales bacterium]|jgi:accessory gene regulator B|nr:accessory gene regulator B family protein [Clostridiales bacterium]
MEILARRLARKVSVSLNYDEEKEAVIAYGLVAAIQILTTILLVFLLGLILGAMIEALIVCFSASILRKYSGGAHAGTAEICTVFSSIFCACAGLVSKKLLTGIYSSPVMAVVLIVIFCLSFIAVYKFAPVDSPNKPIRTEKKKKAMRKGSCVILVAYAVISAVMFFFGERNGALKSYLISMLFGIAWQIFTLTRLGALFIEKMNKLLMRKEVRG